MGIFSNIDNSTDKLNIVLIILSAIFAYNYPLELFILAYSILGPLHYITEINWLNDKSYYFSTKNWIWLSTGLIAAIVLTIPKLYFEYGNMESGFSRIMSGINYWSNSVIFISLILAIGYQFITSKIGWIIISIIGLLGAVFLNGMEHYSIIIGLFIPTIIHVYLFTLIFMAYGAKISKSKFGYLSVALALIIPFIFVFIKIQPDSYLFSDSLKVIYLDNNFHVTPVLLSKYLGLSEGNTFYFYEQMELRLMMFFSFIYCYHYLNWFSKTTVIQWHKMLNIKKTIAIIAIWLLSLFFYYIDFRLGVLLSLFLSFLHVVLEFPLNMLTIKKIFISGKN